MYKLYLKARPDDKQVFVLWEPFVSKMLENPNLRVVVDSSKFSGYIVDVIVANRDFLLKNETLVEFVVGAYFRTAYRYRNEMVDLVLERCQTNGDAAVAETSGESRERYLVEEHAGEFCTFRIAGDAASSTVGGYDHEYRQGTPDNWRS